MPKVHTSIRQRSFALCEPIVWNRLLRDSSLSLNRFESQLKTYHFRQQWTPLSLVFLQYRAVYKCDHLVSSVSLLDIRSFLFCFPFRVKLFSLAVRRRFCACHFCLCEAMPIWRRPGLGPGFAEVVAVLAPKTFHRFHTLGWN